MEYPITRPLRKFARDQNISPTQVYRWIDAGDLESVLIGNRRHIILSSYPRLLNRLREEQGAAKLPSSNPKVKGRPSRRGRTGPRPSDGAGIGNAG
jgi:hypothetical protein